MSNILTVRQCNALVSLNAALKAARACGLFEVLPIHAVVLDTFCEELASVDPHSINDEYAITYHVKAGGVVREDSCIIIAPSALVAMTEFNADYDGKIISVYNRNTQKYCDI